MLLSGCGGGKTPPNHAGNGYLYGTVTRGPTSPVCRIGKPCSKPASGAQLVFTRSSGGATTVVVAKDGSYALSLTPGNYTVAVTPQPQVGRGIEPSTVRVGPGPSRKLDFRIDTGIR